jgi:hypothetical protein
MSEGRNNNYIKLQDNKVKEEIKGEKVEVKESKEEGLA